MTKNRPTDRTHVAQLTKNCTTSLVAHQPTPKTPKSMHASGTSGPLSHVAREPRMGFRQELLDRLLHVTRSDLLDCSKNLPRICVPGGSSSCWRVPPQNAGHDLIPTAGSEGWTDGKSVCRIRFLGTDSSRDKHDWPARTWSLCMVLHPFISSVSSTTCPSLDHPVFHPCALRPELPFFFFQTSHPNAAHLSIVLSFGRFLANFLLLFILICELSHTFVWVLSCEDHGGLPPPLSTKKVTALCGLDSKFSTTFICKIFPFGLCKQ